MIENYKPAWMTPELSTLSESVSRFVEKEVIPYEESWVEQGFTDREVWKKAGQMGILLSDIDEEFSGSGGDFSYEAVVAHELCLAGCNSWRVAKQIHVIAAHYIARYGTEQQKGRWLPGLASGELIAAMGMSEPGAGTDLQRLTTHAHKREHEYVINGAKTFITNGSTADIIILAVKTNSGEGARGVSLFIFETNTPGFGVGSRLKKIGLHGSDTCELFFDDCSVPESNLLGGTEGQGFYQMMQDLAYERCLVGVNCASVMERAFNLAAEYARDRPLFGGTLLDLQNTRIELAEIKTVATIARVFADFTVQRMIDGTLTPDLASMGKWWQSERQCEIVNRCLQIFGGHGYILESPIAKMYLDARVET